MFYTYRQNNSGGVFEVDHSRGISVNVIIEADSSVAADSRAEEIGLYFDGCRSGRDCDCCGERWYSASADEGTETPELYGLPADDNFPVASLQRNGYRAIKWVDGFNIYIHYADGRIEGAWA